jgi:predicted P-loop ATPase
MQEPANPASPESRPVGRIPVTFITHAQSTDITPSEMDLGDLAAFLEVPASGDDKAAIDRDKASVPLWTPAVFGPAKADVVRRGAVVCPAGSVGRFDECVVSVHALVLDYDGKHGAPLTGTSDVLSRWSGSELYLHSSIQYTAEKPRFRVVLPLARPVTADEHRALYEWAKAHDERIDPSTSNPSRFWYWPSVRTVPGLDAPRVYEYVPGKPLDPDTLLTQRVVRSSGGPLSQIQDRRHLGIPSVTSGETSSEAGTLNRVPPDTGSPFARIADADAPHEDFGLILDRCAFVRHAVADAATLPNPEWRALLSIVARCEHGEALAHAVSEPYPGYSPEETDHEYARVQAGPFTCATIERDAGSAWCRACPHRGRITSPAQLGSDPKPIEAPAPPVQRLARVVNLPPAEQAQAVADELEQAEARCAAARAAEGAAVGRRDEARRRYAAVTRGASGSSENDRQAALDEKMAAEAACREASAARVRAERAAERVRHATATVGLPPGADAEVWPRLALISPGGVVKPADTISNVTRIFREDARWATRLSFNEFSGDVCLDGVTLKDTACTELAARLGWDWLLDTTSARVAECIRLVARDRSFHPVRSWLGALRWDGTSRIDTMFLDAFGVQDDARYAEVLRLISRRFLLSMVARVMEPGCQVDTMPVLLGDEGVGKSRGFEFLASKAWFSRSDLRLEDKDSFMQIQGNWLYEIGEMHALRRSDMTQFRSWMSSDTDNYRAPYERAPDRHPRQTVLAGTTNDPEFLPAFDVHRRTWPMTVVRPVDLDRIEETREAWFAEAYALYLSEVGRGRHRSRATRWWFETTDPETPTLREMTRHYTATDAWDETIRKWAISYARGKDPAPVSVDDVCRVALQKQPADISKSDVTRVGRILSDMGVTSERRAVGNTNDSLAYRRVMYYMFDENTKAKLGVPALVGADDARKVSPFKR